MKRENVQFQLHSTRLLFEVVIFYYAWWSNSVMGTMLSKVRRYAIVVILIVGAALTPPDIVSQVLLSVPVYLLYEVGVILVFIFGRKKKKEET